MQDVAEVLRPRHVAAALEEYLPSAIKEQAFEKPWFELADVGPTPATHASVAQLKTGETVYLI